MKILNNRVIVNVVAALLIFIFAYTAVSKFFNFKIFQYTLSEAPLIGERAGIAAYILSVINLVPVVLLLFPSLRRLGLLYSFVLLLVYSCYIGYSLLTATHLPCSCSGIVPFLSWKNHLWVNLGLALLALAGIIQSKRIIAIKPPAMARTGSRAC